MSVHVTGLGLVSPFGASVEAGMRGLARGASCARSVELAGFSVTAAAVPALDAASEALRADHRPAEAFLRLAVAEAVAHAGIDSRGVPLFVGTCSGEMQRFEAGLLPHDWYEQPGLGAARAFDLGPVTTFASACTSSLSALAGAVQAVASGRHGRAIAAGTDAMCSFAASGFFSLKAASVGAATPFARERKGLNFGEGAAAVVIEAAPRQSLARVHGVGLSCDAKHVTAPRADALGLERAVKRALDDAGGVRPELYVSHGTATQANDAMEITLGARLDLLGVPWIAHKAFIGHAMGASALMSFVLATEQLRRGAEISVPYGDWEPGVRLAGSLAGRHRALLAAAAFGGSNAAVAWEV